MTNHLAIVDQCTTHLADAKSHAIRLAMAHADVVWFLEGTCGASTRPS